LGRVANQVQEDEAAEIAGELLVEFESAKLLARRKATNEEVALRRPGAGEWTQLVPV
jgi:hypothetical protein